MIKVNLPLTKAARAGLNAGDRVLLCGKLYTARDAAHKRFYEAIKNKKALPIELEDNVLYYCGPTPGRTPRGIGACGPTTSSRMDDFTPALLDRGLSATIGKGKRSEQVLQAIKKNKSVYLVAIGGAGAYLSRSVQKAKQVAYRDLGAEAVYELVVENFPVVVAIDSRGTSIFKKGYHAKA
jgi:fumarate hydratase subunit beta